MIPQLLLLIQLLIFGGVASEGLRGGKGLRRARKMTVGGALPDCASDCTGLEGLWNSDYARCLCKFYVRLTTSGICWSAPNTSCPLSDCLFHLITNPDWQSNGFQCAESCSREDLRFSGTLRGMKSEKVPNTPLKFLGPFSNTTLASLVQRPTGRRI